MWNGELVNGGGTGLVGGEVGFRWKESHRQERSGKDSIGRAAADREAGAPKHFKNPRAGITQQKKKNWGVVH